MEKSNHPGPRKYLAAAILFICGILLLCRNAGFLSPFIFDLIVGWHSLFIVVGGIILFRFRHLIGGVFLLLGLVILAGILGWLPYGILNGLGFPLILIIAAFVLLFRRRPLRRRGSGQGFGPRGRMCRTENGMLYAAANGNAVRHVVLEKPFEGAYLNAYFGRIEIDLRHTELAAGENVIDVDCTYGYIELNVPSEWAVKLECSCFCGECSDKRVAPDSSAAQGAVLVVRGRVTFGGVSVND